MPEFTEELKGEITEIVKKTRELSEKYGKDSAQVKAYEESTDAKLKEFDEKNDQMVKELAGEKEKTAEAIERIKHLEALGVKGGAAAITAEMKYSNALDVTNAMLKGKSAWNEYMDSEEGNQKAIAMFSEMSKSDYSDFQKDAPDAVRVLSNYAQKADANIMRSDISELGYILCPPEFSAQLNKNIIERAPLRGMVNVKSIGGKSIQEPLRTSIPEAEWEGELEEGGASGSVYVGAEWNPARLTRTLALSRDVIQSSQFDLVNELISDYGIATAVSEGKAFFNGNGVKKYLGWSVDPNVPELETVTNTLDFDDLINLSGELKDGYNPIYTFSRKTLTYLRKLQDSDGRYIWNVDGNGAAGAPVQINGFNYSSAFIENDAPTVADGYPILFADMKLFYQIVDRANTIIIRDEVTQKKKAMIEYTLMKWTSGMAKIPEAGIRLKKIS